MSETRYAAQYLVLTLLLGTSLIWAFVRISNYYPISAPTMMLGGTFARGATYHILCGETFAGKEVRIDPARLTNGLFMRTWGLVTATANNASFKLPMLHPANAALIDAVHGEENLPDGARVPDLIKAWGTIYNDGLPPDSPDRLRSVRLDEYRWPGAQFAVYDQYVRSWQQEL